MPGPHLWPWAPDARGIERYCKWIRDVEKDVLSQKPSPCNLSPPLPLTPSGPRGSHTWSPKLFLLWLQTSYQTLQSARNGYFIRSSFAYKKCIWSKLSLSIRLSFSFSLFFFWLALLHKHLLHKATNYFLSQRKFCGFLPPFPALNL